MIIRNQQLLAVDNIFKTDIVILWKSENPVSIHMSFEKIKTLNSDQCSYGFPDSKLAFWWGIIHLVCTQNFPRNEYFLPPDTHTYMRVSGVKKC